MNEIALVMREVVKRFGAATALDRFTLDVRSGELLALVGPSGSGKSTALHTIVGLHDPDAGEITLHGNGLVGVAPGARDVAMVWQDGALYPHLTVHDNLAFPLKARGKWGEKAVTHMAERLDLLDLLDRLPGELSGGERQRTALGRALIRKPKLFLLDEPLSSLDLPLRERLRTLIRELVRETSVTTVYVTHDQAEAMAVGDRVAVIRAGRVVQAATPREIYEKPVHEFVARFFGNPPMNLLDGCIEDGHVVGEWGRLAIDGGENGRTVRVGFRPEHAAITGEPTGLAATLRRVEYQGHETIAMLLARDAELRLRLPDGEALPNIGDDANLRIDRGNLHLFSADGARL